MWIAKFVNQYDVIFLINSEELVNDPTFSNDPNQATLEYIEWTLSQNSRLVELNHQES